MTRAKLASRKKIMVTQRRFMGAFAAFGLRGAQGGMEFFMNRLRMSLADCARQAAIAATAGLALTVPFNAANAGFFDFLFAPQPAQTAAPIYRPAPHFHYHHQPKRKVVSRHAKFADDRTHPSPARLVSSFMDDDSLKDGDVVMTRGRHPDLHRRFGRASHFRRLRQNFRVQASFQPEAHRAPRHRRRKRRR